MKNYIIPAIVLACLATAGCKPTENNYKEAYDVAQQKRKAAATDPDMVLPAGALKQIGDPMQTVVNGDTVSVAAEHLKFEGGLEGVMKKWNVAVAKYKMPTNCASQTSDLFSEGYQAFYVLNREGYYYVIAGSFDSIGEAQAFAKQYSARHKASSFVGLSGAPLLIEKR